MISKTLPSFCSAYVSLEENIKQKARKTFKQWKQNPFHPSLHFKCINKEEKIWSIRITLNYRALGIYEEDTVTWFWIGSHDDYERFFL
jgi:hypothetical protein